MVFGAHGPAGHDRRLSGIECFAGDLSELEKKCLFAVGKTTGGVFNLAVALGGGVTGALTWSHSWIYILASILGGAAAAALFVYLVAPHAEGD